MNERRKPKPPNEPGKCYWAEPTIEIFRLNGAWMARAIRSRFRRLCLVFSLMRPGPMRLHRAPNSGGPKVWVDLYSLAAGRKAHNTCCLSGPTGDLFHKGESRWWLQRGVRLVLLRRGPLVPTPTPPSHAASPLHRCGARHPSPSLAPFCPSTLPFPDSPNP